MQIFVIFTMNNFNKIKLIKNSITRYKKSSSISILQMHIYYFNNEQIKSNNSLIVQKKKFKTN